MRKSIFASALAAMLVWAGVASAGPLSPALVGAVIAGEGYAPNTLIVAEPGCVGAAVPCSAIQRIDWIVVNDGNAGGGWSYYYQAEVSSISALETITIQSPFFTSIGFFSGVSLDAGFVDPGTLGVIAGHTAVGYANLGAVPAPPELETGFMGGALSAVCPGTGCQDPTSFSLDAFNASWSFTSGGPGGAGLAVLSQSTVLFGRGPAPVYTHWAAIDGFVWTSTHNPNPCPPQDNLCARLVPAPAIPEPASLVLLGSGLVGLGVWARRRQNL
jgi:hypothetical protein